MREKIKLFENFFQDFDDIEEEDIKKSKKNCKKLFDENEKIFDRNNRILVGYWANKYDDFYGLPEENWIGWENKEFYDNFINKLNNLLKKSKLLRYKGWSNCRICNGRNGDGEYIIDNRYVVPYGYSHYIIKHKIRPHKWFLEYVLNN